MWQLYVRKSISFYERKECPTLDSLLGVLKAKELFKGERTTLWKVVHEMGFRMRIGTTYMNNQGLSSNGMTIYAASWLILSSIFPTVFLLSFFLRSFFILSVLIAQAFFVCPWLHPSCYCHCWVYHHCTVPQWVDGWVANDTSSWWCWLRPWHYFIMSVCWEYCSI